MISGFFRNGLFFGALVFSAILALTGCGAKRPGTGGASAAEDASKHIAVFIPGVMSGSPIYEMLAAGVNRAAAEQPGVTVTVIEGGFNQAEWEGRVNALAASGIYDLIVSSNPSLPAIAQSVSAKFPRQQFLLLDGEVSGNPNIYSLRYNQREQAFMAGHIAALVTLEAGGKAAAVRRLGLVAGQEYPAMNTIILPAYLAGAQSVDPAFTVDFRVVGNWFDAGTGASLAADMIRGGTAVILCIAGGANEGVVQAAFEAGAKTVWFDTNGYGIRPGTVVGSSVLYQDKAAYEQTKRYLAGALPFGRAEMVGVADGFVDFVEDDPRYISAVSPEIREKQAELLARIRTEEFRIGE